MLGRSTRSAAGWCCTSAGRRVVISIRCSRTGAAPVRNWRTLERCAREDAQIVQADDLVDRVVTRRGQEILEVDAARRRPVRCAPGARPTTRCLGPSSPHPLARGAPRLDRQATRNRRLLLPSALRSLAARGVGGRSVVRRDLDAVRSRVSLDVHFLLPTPSLGHRRHPLGSGRAMESCMRRRTTAGTNRQRQPGVRARTNALMTAPSSSVAVASTSKPSGARPRAARAAHRAPAPRADTRRGTGPGARPTSC